MPPGAPSALSKELAGLFLLAVAAVFPAAMLAWGREAPPAPPPAPAQHDPEAERAAFLPPEGGQWPVELSIEDGEYLIGLLLDAVGTPAGKGRPVGRDAAARPAPVACTRPLRAPVLVTAYAAGGVRLRAEARAGTLAESVARAAAELASRTGGGRGLRADVLRVRIDVVTEARPFPATQRLAFAMRGFGEPAGVALRDGQRFAFFLPADIADYHAGTNEGMLRAVCRRAGLGAEAWRDPELPLWHLVVAGFVNEAPGGRHALPSPRGLTPGGEANISRLLRASRLAGQYLVRVQGDDGSYRTYWNPASNLGGGCESVPEQAAVAAALAGLCELRPRDEYIISCYEALSYLMRFTDSLPDDPRMAFTRRDEVCHVVWELEASAHVLAALCRYRRVSGMSQPGPWIAALAEFLLFMQREDGCFELKYDARTGARTTPEDGLDEPVPQAKAALSLALAHEALGVPGYLLAARKAVDRLAEAEGASGLAPAEARWLAAAAGQVGSALQSDRYVPWIGRIAAERRRAQLQAQDVPAADLVGATLTRFPPPSGPTADVPVRPGRQRRWFPRAVGQQHYPGSDPGVRPARPLGAGQA
ncbi:MAG: hypothetical protein ACYS8K_06920 [Planctomycetota bacterium]|jgi:hypothetical protein